jgi:hypothetical protein
VRSKKKTIDPAKQWPRVLAHFELSGKETGDVTVRCPFHGEDNHPSASINLFEKGGVFNCFKECGGKTLDAVEQFLVSQAPVEPDEAVVDEDAGSDGGGDVVEPPTDLAEYGEQYLRKRGFDPSDMGVDVTVEDDPDEKLYGYLVLTAADGRYSARNLLPNESPRYTSSPGKKKRVWMVGEDDPSRPLWLAEGTLDAVALYQLGARPVATPLGTTGVTDDIAFSLRGRTVYIVFDADAAGYKAAREVQEKLSEFGVHAIVFDLPLSLGKDVGEAFEKNPEGLLAWINAQRAELGSTDEGYVSRLFAGEERVLRSLSSGIPTWDATMLGGFVEGVHIIGAEPGVGKSCYVLERAARWAELGHRVLYLTYEISKRQSWSRVASIYDKSPWNKLERDPTTLKKATRVTLAEIARKVRIAAGWNVGKIVHVAKNYDAIIIDYLQRMPGPFGQDQSRSNVSHNIEQLSNLARDEGKIVLTVSSIPRSQYGDNSGPGWMKESGNVEYVVQSATKMRRGGDNLVTAEITKNTRGNLGNFWMATDLGHCRFVETAPGERPKVKLG